MALDNLLCKLTLNTILGQREVFKKYAIFCFFNGDKNGILERVKMTTGGIKLTKRFFSL